MGKESLFSGREQPAKASVVLKLRDRQALPPGTVQGIASLVAASVDGLRPESVVVLDTHGRPLLRPNADGEEPLGAAELERQQRYERELSTRVIALLEPVVGPDRVRVNVSARLDAESQEQTEERWDPAGSAIRSRQVSADSRSTASARGVAGARANLPPPADDKAAADGETEEGAPPAPAAAPATAAASLASPAGGTSSETTNFEISKTVRHTVRPRGNVARLSVAVILDHAVTTTRDESGAATRTSAARPPEEIQKIHNLVAASVGLDPSRGDQLTVEQLAFDEQVVEPIEPAWWERWVPEAMQLLRVLAVLVLGALAFFFLVRPLMKRVVSGVPAAPVHQPVMTGPFPKTIQELEGEIGAQLDAAVLQPAGERLKLPVLTKRLANMTGSEPQNAAKLIRTWLNEEGR
jgi:flagellar M-ring protein FliF